MCLAEYTESTLGDAEKVLTKYLISMCLYQTLRKGD